MPSAPYDRAIALACTMRTLRGQWLYVRCRCGASQMRPVRLMLREDAAVAGRSLADVLAHIRCHACAARPASVHLAETASSMEGVAASVRPGWSLLLHGDGGPLPERLQAVASQVTRE